MATVIAYPQPSRREVLTAAGLGATAVAAMGVCGRVQHMNARTFVLVHPAWHGAWFWKKLAPLLRDPGHIVSTPTLTGLGERSHLARADIGLDVHVTDVVNVLKHEDLRDVVIVGDSSSGAVVTGVADRVPERIALVVYLDAFVPENGDSLFDLIAPDRRQAMEMLAKTEGDGWRVPRFAPAPWETIVRDMWGVTDADDVRWLVERLGPTPIGHFRDPVRRTNPVAEQLSRAYIRCRFFQRPLFDHYGEMAQRSARWSYRELAAPHHAAFTAPNKVADLLLDLAQ